MLSSFPFKSILFFVKLKETAEVLYFKATVSCTLRELDWSGWFYNGGFGSEYRGTAE